MIYIVLSIAAAYLIGSVPTGYIFGKAFKGVDIRKMGSGNVGATNVYRTVGKIPGVAVLVIDFLKGAICVTLLPAALQNLSPAVGITRSGMCILLGSAAIAGHIWTVFLDFRGGKGVATTAGVMLGFLPKIFLGGLVVWVVVFAVCKYVSLASISAAVSMPVLSLATGEGIGVILFTSALCMVGVYSHRSNIKRLIHGEERRLVKVKNSKKDST